MKAFEANDLIFFHYGTKFIPVIKPGTKCA